MTTLRIALAQSALRAAFAQTPHGTVEVRALMTDRRGSVAGAPGDSMSHQQTWTGAWRYELLTNGTPQLTGSYSEITDFASHLRVGGCELDWQPVWERASVQPARQPQRGWQ